MMNGCQSRREPTTSSYRTAPRRKIGFAQDKEQPDDPGERREEATTTKPSGDSMSRDKFPPCPSCGSEDIRRYIYGYIRFENKEEKQEFDQKFVMGGCTISEKFPHFHCESCGCAYK
jgi:hypothetical protein